MKQNHLLPTLSGRIRKIWIKIEVEFYRYSGIYIYSSRLHFSIVEIVEG
jgi:hypothetical protein